MNFVKILEHHLLDHKIVHLFTAGPISFDLTMHVVMMWIAGAMLTVLLLLARRRPGVVGGAWPNAVETVVVYIRDELVRPNLGARGDAYLPYFLTLFFFVLGCNLLGLVPFGATATGNIAVTAGLALLTFIMVNLAGSREHGFFHHLKAFVPHGVPWWLAPLMFIVEVAGLLAKTFALCIRLFANMIAGHIVILAFISLIFTFGTIFVAPPAVAVAVAMTFLELLVGFLQAYVFTLLTAVFVGAAVNPH